MKRGLILATAAAALFAFGPTIGHTTEISAKLKSKKVLGDLVPAYACDPFGSDASPNPSFATSGQCNDSSQVKVCSGDYTTKCASDADCGVNGPCIGNITLSKLNGNDCTFQKGKFKIIVGKDAQFLINKLQCGDPNAPTNPSALCTHIASYSTIMDANPDTKGNAQTIQKHCQDNPGTPCSLDSDCPSNHCDICPGGAGGDLAGTSSYAIAQLGTLPCKVLGKSGTEKCKGTVPVVANDPCPNVDKVSQIERVEVFDGPAEGSVSPVPGFTLGACCGIDENVGGGFDTTATSCTGSEVQSILAVPGTTTQVK